MVHREECDDLYFPRTRGASRCNRTANCCCGSCQPTRRCCQPGPTGATGPAGVGAVGPTGPTGPGGGGTGLLVDPSRTLFVSYNWLGTNNPPPAPLYNDVQTAVTAAAGLTPPPSTANPVQIIIYTAPTGGYGAVSMVSDGIHLSGYDNSVVLSSFSWQPSVVEASLVVTDLVINNLSVTDPTPLNAAYVMFNNVVICGTVGNRGGTATINVSEGDIVIIMNSQVALNVNTVFTNSIGSLVTFESIIYGQGTITNNGTMSIYDFQPFVPSQFGRLNNNGLLTITDSNVGILANTSESSDTIATNVVFLNTPILSSVSSMQMTRSTMQTAFTTAGSITGNHNQYLSTVNVTDSFASDLSAFIGEVVVNDASMATMNLSRFGTNVSVTGGVFTADDSIFSASFVVDGVNPAIANRATFYGAVTIGVTGPAYFISEGSTFLNDGIISSASLSLNVTGTIAMLNQATYQTTMVSITVNPGTSLTTNNSTINGQIMLGSTGVNGAYMTAHDSQFLITSGTLGYGGSLTASGAEFFLATPMTVDGINLITNNATYDFTGVAVNPITVGGVNPAVFSASNSSFNTYNTGTTGVYVNVKAGSKVNMVGAVLGGDIIRGATGPGIADQNLIFYNTTLATTGANTIAITPNYSDANYMVTWYNNTAPTVTVGATVTLPYVSSTTASSLVLNTGNFPGNYTVNLTRTTSSIPAGLVV